MIRRDVDDETECGGGGNGKGKSGDIVSGCGGGGGDVGSSEEMETPISKITHIPSPPPPGSRRFRPLDRPLSRKEMERSLSSCGFYSSVHTSAFISEERDAGDVLHNGGRKPPGVTLIKDQYPDDDVDDEGGMAGLALFRRLMEAEEASSEEVSKEDRYRGERSRFVPSIKPPSRKRVKEWGIENGMVRDKSKGKAVKTEKSGLKDGRLETKVSSGGEVGGKVKKSQSSAVPVSGENSQNFEDPLAIGSCSSKDLASQTLLLPDVDGFSSSNAYRGGDNSAIEGPTLIGGHGFRCGQETALGDVKAVHETSHVTVMSLEVHCVTRGELFPDPEFDPISAG